MELGRIGRWTIFLGPPEGIFLRPTGPIFIQGSIFHGGIVPGGIGPPSGKGPPGRIVAVVVVGRDAIVHVVIGTRAATPVRSAPPIGGQEGFSSAATTTTSIAGSRGTSPPPPPGL